MHNAVIGPSDDIIQILTNIASNPTVLRLSVLGQIVTSSGIIVLAVLLYFVTRKYNRIIAAIALSCWLAEAITLAVSQMGTAALVPLSLEIVRVPAQEEPRMRSWPSISILASTSWGSRCSCSSTAAAGFWRIRCCTR
jgi:hypothetical protein